MSPFVPQSRRRGSVLVMTVWVVIILSALLLVFARSMRTEVISSGNRWAAQRAAAVEMGAEQYVLALTEAAKGDSTLVTDLPLEQIPVGDGYFWVLRPDPENDANYIFGIGDEAAKLDVNFSTLPQLLKLPGMTENVADAIADWRDSDSEVKAQGAENDYYTSLPVPYQAKNGALETVEELLLVKDFTEDLYRGYDLNRDGVVSAAEQGSGGGGLATGFNSAGSTGRGLLPFLTVYSVDPNTSVDGRPRVSLNQNPTSQPATPAPGGGTGSGAAAGTGASTAATLEQVLQELLPAQRAQAVLQRARAAGSSENIFDFARKVELQPAELALLADRLTHSTEKEIHGLINVSTAPREVLATLPGLEGGDIDALLGARAGADLTNIAWAYGALTPAKAAAIGARITARSYQYSADILAVSGDGRAFKRVWIVVDARTAPARIVYRRDLTELGWPLSPEIRDTLRSGNRLPTISAAPGRITSAARTALANAK